MIENSIDFPGQFRLSQELEAPAPGWQVHRLQGWNLAVHSLLPVCYLQTTDGSHVGWILGYAIHPDGYLLGRSHNLPFQTPLVTDPNVFEQHLYSFGGRFLCILLTQHRSRLYLDACGSLATVYSTTDRVVASTISLLTTDPPNLNHWRAFLEQFPGRNQFYPAGLTADARYRRLLPNHYLDLEKWEVIRHWPVEPLTRVSESSVSEQVAIIVEHMRRNILAITRQYPTYIGLTAGRDSRMELACSKDFVQNMTFVTYAYNDQSSATDVDLARSLAARYQLQHRVIPIGEPDDDLKLLYLHRIGGAGNWGKSSDFYAACLKHLNMNSAFLTGYGGEVGRGYYWGKVQDAQHLPDAAELLKMMWLPVSDPFRDAMEQWLTTMLPVDVYMLLDQMYLEQRLGCWAGPHMYGTAPFRLNMTPFCHRAIFTAMMRLPVEYRRAQRLAEDIIRQVWPELIAFPFNKQPGWRGVVNRATKRIKQQVKKVVKKLN